jgi:hypothetical protein
MTQLVTVLSPMAKSPEPADGAQEIPSGTVRVDGPLLEKARYVCFHRRDERGKRVPLAQYIDQIIRAVIEKDYEDEQEKQAKVENPRKKKRPPPIPEGEGE